MEEKHGKFINGAWIDVEQPQEQAPAAPGTKQPAMDQRIGEVSAMVSTSFHQLIALARDLITTPEGHAHIEKQIQQASSQVEKALNEILKSGDEKEEGGPDQGKRKEIRIDQNRDT